MRGQDSYQKLCNTSNKKNYLFQRKKNLQVLQNVLNMFNGKRMTWDNLKPSGVKFTTTL